MDEKQIVPYIVSQQITDPYIAAIRGETVYMHDLCADCNINGVVDLIIDFVNANPTIKSYDIYQTTKVVIDENVQQRLPDKVFMLYIMGEPSDPPVDGHKLFTIDIEVDDEYTGMIKVDKKEIFGKGAKEGQCIIL